MKIIQFTIKGNQESPTGNPIPYYRTTQRGQFNKGAKRYHAWKDYVRATYLDALDRAMNVDRVIDRADFGDAHDLIQKKPIKAADHKQKMSLKIFFQNRAHADCDNIFKGIADALFMNDKYLIGEFDFVYTDKKDEGGAVTVTLEL